MPRVFVIAFILTSLSNGICSDPKYSATTIPEELKKGMYAIIRESDSKFYIDSKRRSTNHVRLVITILNSNAKNYASLTIGYDKLSKVESFKANVYDAQGNLIKRLKQNEIVDQSSVSNFSLYEDTRIKHADLTQNTYPYTVEFEYIVTYRYLYFIPDFQLYNDDEISTQRISYSIIYPKELKPRYKLFKIEEPKVGIETDKRESLTWTFQNIKPNKFEKLTPGYDRVIPNIKAAPIEFEFEGYVGNMRTWEEYGKWQALLNKGRDILPEITKQKVKDLTKDLKTTEEKTKAIYQYLQNKTRYVGIQLGIGGWQPFDATLVDETGYGDCKALSNYAVALLKEVGVKAYYTKIMAGENAPDVVVDFPSAQSNHIIVAVPNNQDTLWLECTSQTNPFGYLGTFTGDRKALMITEDGGKLVHTLRYDAKQNTQVRKADVFLKITGDGSAKVQTNYSGLQYENEDLNFYLNKQADDQKKWLQRNIKIPTFDINAFTMVNEKGKIPSAIVNVDLTLNRLAAVNGKRIFLTPNLMNRSTFIPEKVESRKTNVVLKMAYTDIDTIQYHLPEGIYPEFLPQPVKLKSNFGEYDISFKLEQNSLLYIRKLKMNKGEFPPDSYTELIEFFRNINKADNTKLVFLSKT
jgi:transglutaminase-like putative cysteine protease